MIIGDLLSIINELRSDADTLGDPVETISGNLKSLLINGKRGGNIKSQARNNICQFPVLMSDAISKNTMYILSTALEKEYLNDIKLLIDNKNLYSVQNNNGKLDKQAFIRQFHSNDRFDNSAIKHIASTALGGFTSEEMVVSNKQLLTPYNENYNYKILATNEDVMLAETKLDDEYLAAKKELDDANAELLKIRNSINNAHPNSSQQAALNLASNRVAKAEINFNKIQAIYQKEYHSAGTNTTEARIRNNNAIEKEKLDADRAKIDTARAKVDLAMQTRKMQMMDNPDVTLSGVSYEEIRKANELQPLILKTSITYLINSGQNTQSVTTDIHIGIKTIMHPIKSSEMVYYIPKMLREGRFLFNFIRYTTGEIAFFKDLVLQFDANKQDALMVNKQNSTRWFKHLKDRSKAAKFKSLLSKDKLIPNATLVITREEADLLKNKYKIDLLGSGKKEARKLMDILFLMNFIIVDETDEIMYSYDDTNNNWEYHAFRELKNPSDKSDESLDVVLAALGGKSRR